MNAAELALAEAITSALETANLGPQDIDYINAHGNSLPDYDLIETRAFHRVFGKAAYSVPASSIKSMIGHAMGAASAFQTVSSCLTLEHSVIPPTINYEVPDPECDLDYVPNEARISRVRTVLINAHAMGGTHSVLVLAKPEF
jgi:3-oxoacyl-(acyl-carrier-protein) synthase